MSLKVLFLVSLTALISSCGSDDSVKDDWPGINDIQLVDGAGTQSLAVNKQFSLNSSVSLPKMGKDVSFTFETSCDRELPSRSNKQKTYTKSVEYKASTSQSISSIDIIDHLADEVLIFPEFFKTCDLKFTAKNQNGSTDKSDLTGYEFVVDADSFGVKITSDTLNKNALRKEDFKLVKTVPKNSGTLTNSELICFTNQISKSIINKNSEKEILGTLFKLPKPTRDIPVENCVVKALNNENKTVVSNRIQILNNTNHEKFTAGVHSFLVSDPKKQIFYNKKSIRKGFNVVTFVISNESEGTQIVKFPESAKSFADLHIMTHLDELKSTIKSGYSIRNYRPVYAKHPSAYEWKNEQLKSSNKIILKPGEYANIELKLKPDFECMYYKNTFSAANRNFEIGFVASLPKNSKTFDIQHVSVNDFTEDAISTGNILDTFKLPYKLPSNLPHGHALGKSDDIFQIFFRNNHIAPNQSFGVSYKVTPDYFSEKTGELIVQRTGGSPFAGYAIGRRAVCFTDR